MPFPLSLKSHAPVVCVQVWDCSIPGKKGTIWEGGLIPVTLKFTDDYATEPPSAQFKMMPPDMRKPLFHPNVFNDGKICLNLLRRPPQGVWNPAHTIKTTLIAIQRLLTEPNNDDAAQVGWHARAPCLITRARTWSELVTAAAAALRIRSWLPRAAAPRRALTLTECAASNPAWLCCSGRRPQDLRHQQDRVREARQGTDGVAQGSRGGRGVVSTSPSSPSRSFDAAEGATRMVAMRQFCMCVL